MNTFFYFINSKLKYISLICEIIHTLENKSFIIKKYDFEDFYFRLLFLIVLYFNYF